MPNERKIYTNDASLYRLQAMMEASIKIQVNILAELTKQDMDLLFAAVHTEIQNDTEELIRMHSHLGDDPNPIQN